MLEIIQHEDVRRLRMWTRGSMLVGYDVSAYLVRGILVDTGFRHVAGDLQRALTQVRPRGVIVTHWHEDHAGNAPAIAMSGTPMWLAPYTEGKLRERQQVKLYRHVVWGRPDALRASVTPFDPSPLQLVPTPGHSPDHHIVFDPETRTIISGDLWLGIRVKIVGATENPYAIVDSLTRTMELQPQRMFDAHRGLVQHPMKAIEAKRAWLQDIIGAVERALDSGASEREIVKQVLGGEERTAIFSEGEYSRRNFVRTIVQNRSRPRPAPPAG